VETVSSGFTISSVYPPKAGFTGRITSPVSTVMVPVRELYDRLEIEPAIETELVQLGLPVDCPPEDNICLRAWRLMHERYGAGPVRIVLESDLAGL